MGTLRLSASWLFCVAALIASTAWAASGYSSPDSRMPSPVYHSTNQVSFITPGGTYSITSLTENWADGDRINQLPVGTFQQCVVPNATYPVGTIYPDASVHSTNATGSTTEIITQTSAGHATIEITALDITVADAIRIRESQTQQSTGTMTVTDLGGSFQVDSQMDIYTELSDDAGTTWYPASGPLHLSGELPEPGSLGLCGVALVGVVASRRHRVLESTSTYATDGTDLHRSKRLNAEAQRRGVKTENLF